MEDAEEVRIKYKKTDNFGFSVYEATNWVEIIIFLERAEEVRIIKLIIQEFLSKGLRVG